MASYVQRKDKNFYGAIYHDVRYHVSSERRGGKSGGMFYPMEQQLQLPRYFSPAVGPARSLILMHNTGSGKTSAMILCFLEFRILENARPALVLVPNDHVKQEFLNEVLGRVFTESGGKAKSFFRRGVTGDAFLTQEIRDILNSLDTERQKDVMVRKIWDEQISKYFEVETHVRFEKRVLSETMTSAQLDQVYGNRRIAIDEGHAVRGERRLYRALVSLTEACRNMSFLFMTATPMIESAEEVCPIINLCLRCEGVPQRKWLTPEVVRTFLQSADGEEIEWARELLMEAFRGRISYVRGMDPRSFPTRVDQGDVIFGGDLPSQRVWSCYMKGKQLKAYLESFMVAFAPNAEAGQRNDLWNEPRERGRVFLLPGMGTWQKHSWRGSTKNSNWKLENVGDVSVKMEQMWRITQDFHPVGQSGPILIYSANVETGVNPNITFYMANGTKAWSSDAEVMTKDAAAPRLVNISGMVSIGFAKEAIKILKSDTNYLGQIIRYVFGSPKVCTGVTLRHFSAVIINEVGWTWAELEQLIGRLIRHGSHDHCSVQNSNRCVMVYVLCSRIRGEDIDALSDKRFVARIKQWIQTNSEQLDQRGFLGEDGQLLTVDERTLRVALIRDRDIARVLRLMKEMALPLNLGQNFFSEEGNAFSRTRLYEYEDTPARVPVPSEYDPQPARLVPPIPLDADRRFESLDAWFRFVCGADLDFFGNIRFAFDHAFEDRQNWVISDLVKRVSRDACVATREVELVLSGMGADDNMVMDLERGWVYYKRATETDSQSHSHLDTISYWQNSLAADGDLIFEDKVLIEAQYDPGEPLKGLCDVLRDHVDVDELLGIFEDVAPVVDIASCLANNCVLLNPGVETSCVFEMAQNTLFCGAYDNTTDNPDEYCLKIVSVRSDGVLSKIAAKSKYNVDGLVSLVNEIDGDSESVMAASHKKNAACEELTLRFKETGRLLPYMPSTPPTLFRSLMVGKAWNIDELEKAINEIVERISVKPNDDPDILSPIEILCLQLLKHVRGQSDAVSHAAASAFVTRAEQRAALVKEITAYQEEEYDPVFRRKIRKQLLEHQNSIEHFVLRVLDRMAGKRPRMWNSKQWYVVRRWYAFYVGYKPDISGQKIYEPDIPENVHVLLRNEVYHHRITAPEVIAEEQLQKGRVHRSGGGQRKRRRGSLKEK